MSYPRARIILASGSTIRREMLVSAGVEITVRVGSVDEDSIKKQGLAQRFSFKEIAKTLALAKAQEFPLQKNECVIGADQLLEFEGQIFDKPKTMKDARKRLLAMRGKIHSLIGVAVIVQKGESPWVQTVVTQMHMRKFTESFLDTYLQREGDKILNSVGGYMFENGGAQLFSFVDGDFFAILGLPLLPVLERLRKIGALET